MAMTESALVRIACVGDSITWGFMILHRKRDCYPAQLQRLLGEGFLVGNFGINGHTLQDSGDQPYRRSRPYRDSLEFDADVVLIMLGTNDSRPGNWSSTQRYREDYRSLVDDYRALPSAPRVYVMTPPAVYGRGRANRVMYGMSAESIDEMCVAVRDLAREEGLGLIDVQIATSGHPEAFRLDGVHPGAEGATLIARAAYDALAPAGAGVRSVTTATALRESGPREVTDPATLPNLPESLAPLVSDGRIPLRRVWGMLALRSVLTFGLLLGVAAALAFAGRDGVVTASSAWWLWFVTVANITCIALMARFASAEGMRLRDIFYASKATWKGDVKWALIALAGSVVLAMPPASALAAVLWGDANYPNTMLFQALPLWAVYPLFVLMPATQALAELPIYWGYVAPRLRASGLGRWTVIGVVGLTLSLQHLFFSFQLDWRYDLWLALRFLPFAVWTGFIVDRRPTALPYLMGSHFVLDASLPLLVLMASRGMPLG